MARKRILGQYDYTIKGYFYMQTVYDVSSKKEAKEQIHKMHPNSKITYLSDKKAY